MKGERANNNESPLLRRRRVSKTEVGTVWQNGNGDIFEVIEKLGGDKRRVLFIKTKFENIVSSTSILTGAVNDPYSPRLCGVGFMGIGDYGSKTHKKEHKIWSDMIRRCYDRKTLERYPTYKGCSVDAAWHNFQDFASWCKSQIGFDQDLWNLDKDILLPGNEVYSPHFCRFIPREINIAFSTNIKNIGKDLPTGITMRESGKYVVQISRFGRNRKIFSGYSLEMAVKVYKEARELYMRELADKWRCKISEDIYTALINYSETDKRRIE